MCKSVGLCFLNLLLGSSPSVCLFVLSNSDVMVFVLSYYILFYYYPLQAFLFSTERQKGGWIWMGGEVEKRGGVEGEETVVRMYCVKKKNFILNKREKIS